jgi:hypothetical protein
MTFKVKADDPESLRLASRFLIELDRPAQFNNEAILKAWAQVMDRLLKASGLEYEEFRWFLIWACRDDEFGNHWTAENLRLAKDPPASLERQFETTLKVFNAKHRVVELLKEKREEEDLDAKLYAPLNLVCPDCVYGPDGERTLCFDCCVEWEQSDDAFYDLDIHLGPGKCEVEECDGHEYRETGLCWFHLCNAMDGVKPFSGKLDPERIRRRLRIECAVKMYNDHVCASNGEPITDRDLVEWSSDQIEAVIWLAELNRGQRVNTEFRNSGKTAKFSSLGRYVEKAMENVTKKYMEQTHENGNS